LNSQPLINRPGFLARISRHDRTNRNQQKIERKDEIRVERVQPRFIAHTMQRVVTPFPWHSRSVNFAMTQLEFRRLYQSRFFYAHILALLRYALCIRSPEFSTRSIASTMRRVIQMVHWPLHPLIGSLFPIMFGYPANYMQKAKTSHPIPSVRPLYGPAETRVRLSYFFAKRRLPANTTNRDTEAHNFVDSWPKLLQNFHNGALSCPNYGPSQNAPRDLSRHLGRCCLHH